MGNQIRVGVAGPCAASEALIFTQATTARLCLLPNAALHALKRRQPASVGGPHETSWAVLFTSNDNRVFVLKAVRLKKSLKKICGACN
jgi:hypothetical protein